MISSVAFALLASAALVAGHGRVTDVKINGVLYPGSQNYNTPENDKSPVRGLPNDLGFVNYNNVNTPDIACSSGGYTPRKLTPEVPAGGQYPVCIQIKVTGGGNAAPATTPATQLYTTENGIVDIYTPADRHGISPKDYKIPGPALHVAGSASVSGRTRRGHGQSKKRISH
ncbi:hypothetical protein RSAG8_13555, partial [Rhizoctonia solani AG-8 WAC10335]